MDESYRVSLPDTRDSSFNVRRWLADVTRIDIDSIQFVAESERSGRRVVTYDCGGTPAKVRMGPVAGAAAWELIAEVSGTVDRVVVPGATRFLWRTPRGTHA
jgi:hypothetical protein